MKKESKKPRKLTPEDLEGKQGLSKKLSDIPFSEKTQNIVTSIFGSFYRNATVKDLVMKFVLMEGEDRYVLKTTGLLPSNRSMAGISSIKDQFYTLLPDALPEIKAQLSAAGFETI